jgi:hypothetical protein
VSVVSAASVVNLSGGVDVFLQVSEGSDGNDSATSSRALEGDPAEIEVSSASGSDGSSEAGDSVSRGLI